MKKKIRILSAMLCIALVAVMAIPAGSMNTEAASGHWVKKDGVKHWIKANGKEVKATKYIAFTYDDGPSKYTSKILKTLNEYGCSATFFQVGNRVGNYKSVEKKIKASDSEIGNHSYTHANLGRSSASKIKSELNKTNKKIKKIAKVSPTLIRPPYGSTSKTLKKNAKAPLILWSIDTLDWKHRSTSKTAKAIMKNPKDGDIVLMHDLYKPSYKATQKVVPELIKKGYKIVSVSELAKIKEKKLKKGKTYSRIK